MGKLQDIQNAMDTLYSSPPAPMRTPDGNIDLAPVLDALRAIAVQIRATASEPMEAEGLISALSDIASAFKDAKAVTIDTAPIVEAIASLQPCSSDGTVYNIVRNGEGLMTKVVVGGDHDSDSEAITTE